MPRAAAISCCDALAKPASTAALVAVTAAADGLGAADTVIEANNVAADNNAINFFMGHIPPFPIPKCGLY